MMFHLLNHLVEDIKRFEDISVLNAFFINDLTFILKRFIEGQLGGKYLVCGRHLTRHHGNTEVSYLQYLLK